MDSGGAETLPLSSPNPRHTIYRKTKRRNQKMEQDAPSIQRKEKKIKQGNSELRELRIFSGKRENHWKEKKRSLREESDFSLFCFFGATSPGNASLYISEGK